MPQLWIDRGMPPPSPDFIVHPANAQEIAAVLKIANTYRIPVVPWGGGSFTVALNNNRQTTTNATALYNPQFNTNWSGTYTQPLMRNFKIDSNRQLLVVTKLNQDISDLQLQSTITNTTANVRNALIARPPRGRRRSNPPAAPAHRRRR